MSEYCYRRRVQFAETDMAGIVHFSAYFRYMEEAEHALWRAAGLTVAPAGAEPGWPRVAAAFDYKAPLRFGDEFDVWVRIVKVSARTIQYGYTLKREGTVIGHGLMTAACVMLDPEGVMKAVEIPAGILDRLRGAITGG